jgi:hypothetical protein
MWRADVAREKPNATRTVIAAPPGDAQSGRYRRKLLYECYACFAPGQARLGIPA